MGDVPNLRTEGAPNDGVPDLSIEGLPNNGVGESQTNDGGAGGLSGAGGDDSTSNSDLNNGAEEVEQYLSKSAYGSARSTLVHIYRSCGTTMEDDFREDMANFMRGIKRKVATQK